MASQAAVLPKSAQQLKRLVPLFNRILVRKMEEPTESKGGILLPDSKKPKLTRGTVLACGPGTRNEKGVQIPMTVKPGDEVLLPDFGGTKIDLDEETYFLFRESEILAKYTN